MDEVKKTTEEKLARLPLHIAGDERKRNANIDAGETLCNWCDGTGNEFYSMYRACIVCKGTGVLPPELKELKKDVDA